MEERQNKTARIGMVNYLNVAPIHEKWKETVHETDWQLIEAPPAALNKLLREEEIDLGFVSSFEYGMHPERYQILAGLSISANGPVGSVFLFSHQPLDRLDGTKVLLSSESETSINLVKIILEDFHGVNPDYCSGMPLQADEDCQAVLAIGDDALRLVEESTYLYQYDLGDIWKRQTGLPFVFALCVVQEEFCATHKDVLAEIHRQLLRCRDEGKRDLKNICTFTASRIPMAEDKCYQYLKGIEHDLTSEKRKALEKFFEYLINREDIPPQALPLKIFGTIQD
jgi:chorismate dehydratase